MFRDIFTQLNLLNNKSNLCAYSLNWSGTEQDSPGSTDVGILEELILVQPGNNCWIV